MLAQNDETWIRDFKPEMKFQNDIWKGPHLPWVQKIRRQQLKMKEFTMFAYDNYGGILTNQVPTGTIVIGAY